MKKWHPSDVGMAWNGFPGSSMIATGCAAGCAHAAASIFDGDLSQEAADQLSEMRMMTTIRRPMSRNFSID